jgi:hypothetical protein
MVVDVVPEIDGIGFPDRKAAEASIELARDNITGPRVAASNPGANAKFRSDESVCRMDDPLR